MCTVRLAMDLSSGRPVCSYELDDRAFVSIIQWIVQGVADGSIAYADCAAPDGSFRIRRRSQNITAGSGATA